VLRPPCCAHLLRIGMDGFAHCVPELDITALHVMFLLQGVGTSGNLFECDVVFDMVLHLVTAPRSSRSLKFSKECFDMKDHKLHPPPPLMPRGAGIYRHLPVLISTHIKFSIEREFLKT